MASVDDLSSTGNKLYNAIEKVEINRGILEEDPIVWEIHISGKNLKIDAEKLESQGAFRVQFLRAFNRPAPKVSSKEWEIIIELLAEEKSEIIENEEESENVYIAEQIFECIKRIPISEDEADALNGRCLLRKGELCLLKAQKITEIARELGFNVVPNRLSPVMTKLNFKKAGTRNVRLDKIDTRVWEFFSANFSEA
ncbi:MAG: hypothetical protein ABFD07_00280 [Methanobacterium sp.]